MDVRLIATQRGPFAVRSWAGEGPPLVCLHGFTLHGGMFGSLAAHLRQRVFAPDLPGHGMATQLPADLDATIDALAGWLRRMEGERVVLLGYSQGGRIAQHLAAHAPDVVERLIVVSAATRLDHAERSERAVADEDLAARIERDGLERFLDDWLEHPLVGTHMLDAATRRTDRAVREENTAPRLAAALRGLGQGVVLPADLDSLTMPVLWVAGQHDVRYTAAARDRAAETHGYVAIVPGVGHNVVLEAPQKLADVVAGFAADQPG